MRRQLVACCLVSAVLLAGCSPAATPASTQAGQDPGAQEAGAAAQESAVAPAGQEPGPAQHEPEPNRAEQPVSAAGQEAAPAQHEASAGVQEAAPADQQTSAVQLPALPLWGEPGLHLTLERAARGYAYTYAPVELLGMTLQPVRLPQGVAYMRVEGDAVYLHGTETTRGGFSLLEEPVLLHRLPLRAGDTWSIEFPGIVGQRYTYTVEAVEPVGTPAGERPAARIAVTRGGELDSTEWWVPGYGLVSYATRWQSWGAERELALDPQLPSAVGRPAPDMQAILWDDGDNYWITTVDGERELFRVSDSYWRSWYGWADAGEFDLLQHTLYPGSWGIYRFTAYRWDPEEGSFRQIDWVSSAGTTWAVAGDGGWGPDGFFRLHDFTGYPSRVLTFRFDGEAMRADPAEEVVIRARSAEDFVDRLFDAPPLEDADILAMFRDPATGEQALKLLREMHPHGPMGFATVRPVEGNPGTFLVTDGDTRLIVEVERGEHDYEITRFERVADGE